MIQKERQADRVANSVGFRQDLAPNLKTTERFG
jgi:hypothetical protein